MPEYHTPQSGQHSAEYDVLRTKYLISPRILNNTIPTLHVLHILLTKPAQNLVELSLYINLFGRGGPIAGNNHLRAEYTVH
jgi:hypothetical protein